MCVARLWCPIAVFGELKVIDALQIRSISTGLIQ